MKANRNLYPLLLLAGTGIALLSTSCSQTQSKAEKKATDIALGVFELKQGALSATTRIPGELVSFRDVDLYAKVNSFVKQLYVDVGSEVKEGQLLATMEAPEIISQLNAARSRVESQTATYRASKANYDRLLETSKTPGTISQNDLDQAQSKMKSDFSLLEAAEAAQREISTLQSYLEVRAPFDGVISAKSISAGAYVGPSGKGSDLPMFTLNEQKTLRLVVYVPEAITGYIHLNDQIKFSVKSLPKEGLTAQVKRKAGALDKKLRSQRIEMDVNNSSRKLLPGMIAEVSISLETDANTFIVPASAIVNSTERVFVIRTNDKKAEWIDVKKGLESNGQIEVFGKLNAGDELVLRANEEIRNGSAIAATMKVVFK